MIASCPSDVIVPIIFVPGIMGSRLHTKSSPDEVIWDPDDIMFMLRKYGWNAGSVVGPDLFRMREKANVRQAAMTRKELLIGGASFNKDYLEPITFQTSTTQSMALDPYWGDAAKRNWSSVVSSSYGNILTYLETQKLKISQEIKKNNPQFNLLEMPVWALGYNWSASNYDSGRYAAEKIKDWVGQAKQRAAELGIQCPGAIVLTHSMGGLVTRSAAMIHGAASDIFAVIHTVMPTDGAAAAYKRFHFGFENPDASLFSPIKGVKDHGGYVVLGRQGALVTAILGHMPGGQELLPNKRYKDNNGNSKWLTIHNPERNLIGHLRDWVSDVQPLELPDSNPYTEIYRREDRMYRAANPEWLFPEGMENLSPNKPAFDYFTESNEDAEMFHECVISAGDFHEVTYLCYSDDTAFRTYDRIDWKTDKPLGSWGRRITEENVAADRTDDYRREHLVWGDEEDKEISGGLFGVDFRIDSPGGAGDKTVPASAGRYVDPNKVPPSRRKGHTSGYEHEPALSDSNVQSWVKDTIVEVLGECSLY